MDNNKNSQRSKLGKKPTTCVKHSTRRSKYSYNSLNANNRSKTINQEIKI